MNEIDHDFASRPLQRLKTRERILAAARSLVAQDGYAALSMRRLAAAVDYSPAALYLHFKSRDEIAHILRGEALAALAAALDTPVHDAADLHRVQALGRAWLNFARTQPQLYQLGLLDRLGPATEPGELSGTAQSDPAAQVLRSVLAALQHPAGETLGGAQPNYGLDARAETVVAVLHGLTTLHLLQPALLSVPIDALLQVSLKSLLRGWPGLRGSQSPNFEADEAP
jgi:AcrR family transcriptional regulator